MRGGYGAWPLYNLIKVYEFEWIKIKDMLQFQSKAFATFVILDSKLMLELPQFIYR